MHSLFEPLFERRFVYVKFKRIHLTLSGGNKKENIMQTFLPYADFYESARCLDYRRLGKQRVEVLQIVNTLLNPGQKGWKNHPAVIMWKSNIPALSLYGVICCNVWISKQYRDTCKEKILNSLSLKMDGVWTEKILQDMSERKSFYPTWFGWEEFHSSHRSNLLRKNYDFYKKYGWNENTSKPYIWPVPSNPSSVGSKP